MTSRTFAIVLAACLAASAVLLVLGAVLDSSALAIAGLAPLVVLGIARTIWTYGE